MVLDAIVFGTKDHKIRDKCITEGSELTLEKAIDFARTYELSKAQLKSMESEDTTINMLNKDQDQIILHPVKSMASNTHHKGDHLKITRGNHPISQTNAKTVELDTRAKCNVLSLHKLKTICSHPIITKQVSPLRSYSGHTIDTVGVINLRCSYKCQDHAVKFHIVDRNVQSVIGAKTCKAMKLLKRIHYIQSLRPAIRKKRLKPFLPEKLEQQYGDLFTGLECLPGTHKIRINKTVAPVVHAPRKVPIASKDKVKAELDRMEDISVIFKQQEPTQWVNSMVTVIKPNVKFRICIDPRDLNKAILPEHYPLKTVEEAGLSAQRFSKYELRSLFSQIGKPLKALSDEASVSKKSLFSQS
ncbi:unnamed protein product [Mytilus coruscus]|uniref:Uncharacterized protein n=1 Tax=Mytilus coruscus TaxID=42192 RepID=A0A6J8C1K6_MYTCO|nr:unnamed protein product [Mytilus coruscus]